MSQPTDRGLDPVLGVWSAGTNGTTQHLGDPLTCQQIRELEDGAEVVITWCGGNGPYPYRILVDTGGARRVESLHTDILLAYDTDPERPQTRPLHRVTLGWDDDARSWIAKRFPPRAVNGERVMVPPEHVLVEWARLRGQLGEMHGMSARDGGWADMGPIDPADRYRYDAFRMVCSSGGCGPQIGAHSHIVVPCPGSRSGAGRLQDRGHGL